MTVELLNKLKNKNMTVAAAESCTGGLISSAFVDLPGASDVFVSGIVTYKEESKCTLLGVKEETLKQYTAVSSRTAAEMCENAAKKCGTDIGLSSTGYAGPDGGTEENPVGTVYIGVYIYGKAYTKRLELKGNRNYIRKNAVEEVLLLLEQLL